MRADPEVVNQAELIRESSMQAVESFPQDIQDMIKNTDASSLHLAQLKLVKYRPPWDMMRRNFQQRHGCIGWRCNARHGTVPGTGWFSLSGLG
ncbi:hypothetical protein QQ045_004177 [Rhodiola kirilowii]